MKQTYYFPHDFNARNDHKLEELFLKWGCEGRGIFWTLIEMLYENKGYLPYDKIDYYANALRTQSERITSILNDFDLFKNDGVRFWSDSCLERLEHIMEKSQKASQSAMKRWGKDANAMHSLCERNAIKDKKEEEIRYIIPPSLETVSKYCKDRKNSVNADSFINHYTAKGWMIGKNKMKDWQAAVRTWEKNSFETNKKHEMNTL